MSSVLGCFWAVLSEKSEKNEKKQVTQESDPKQPETMRFLFCILFFQISGFHA
jgi:hypothetical protein